MKYIATKKKKIKKNKGNIPAVSSCYSSYSLSADLLDVVV